MAKKEVVKKVGKITFYSDNSFRIDGVIMAYPQLIKAKAILDNPTPKFTVGALLSKETHGTEIEALKKFIKKQCEDKKFPKVPSDKMCLRDGDDLGSEAYEPYYRLNMGASEAYAPVLRIKGDRKDRQEDIDELEEVVVMGAVGSVLGDLYFQDNQYGKRVNCNIIAANFTGKSVELNLGSGVGDDDDIWESEDDDDLDDDDF